MDRVFGVKEEKVLIMSWFLACAISGDVEAWDRIRTFHFDVLLRCLLHIRVEMKNRQMDKLIWGLEVCLG